MNLNAQKMASNICFYLSVLLSSMSASFSGRLSHEEQDGNHQFSDPQIGSHWHGLERPIIDPITMARDALCGEDRAMCPLLETGMRLQLLESQMSPKRKLWHCSQQGGNGTGQGVFTVHCDLVALLLRTSNLTERKSHRDFFPKTNKASNFIPKYLK